MMGILHVAEKIKTLESVGSRVYMRSYHESKGSGSDPRRDP